jgi:hypothetical protein
MLYNLVNIPIAMFVLTIPGCTETAIPFPGYIFYIKALASIDL